MKYMILGYDSSQACFKSRDGLEYNVCIKPEAGYSYYLSGDRKRVIKLLDGWISKAVDIGHVLTLSGSEIGVIPHPGVKHSQFAIGGITKASSEDFCLIIEPFDNSDSYFIKFDLQTKTFSEAGNTVR